MLDYGIETMRPFFTLGGLAFFLSLELLVPYRPSTVPKFKRWADNLGLTLFNTVLLYVLFASAIVSTAAYVTEHKLGVLHLVDAPRWLEVLFFIAFMDFILYVWHFLNHEMPLFWRFHRVHHTDINMDVSSATRFHIGELGISALIKLSLIFFLGADLFAVVLFESLVVFAAQVHHSSVKVPRWFESIYWLLFVPPSMHRIHHSVIIKERNTNYGTIFSLWDRFLGTMLSRVDQDRIRIGVGAYPRFETVHLPQLLVMPFAKPVK